MNRLSRRLSFLDRLRCPPHRPLWRKFALLLFIGAALFPLMRAWAITPGSSVYLETAAVLPYGGGGSTNYFWVNGKVAYCSNPETWTPYSGWYTKSTLKIPSTNHTYHLEDIRTILWFGYGGPGFDKSMWPKTDWDGSALTDAEYQAYTHVLLADRMWCSGTRALFGCSLSFKQWYAPHFLGYAWSGGPGPSSSTSSVISKMEARKNEVPPADEFDVYMIDTGYNANIGTGEQSQTIVTFEYHPKVRVTFNKISAQANLTQGNGNYSLDGAVYEIHLASNDAVVDTVTTDAKGKASLRLEPDTAYYAVEIAAPAGFVVDSTPIPFHTGDATEVDLPDQPGTITLQLIKTDAATGGAPQPGASLEGAEFKVVDANGAAHTIRTDAQGRAALDGLPLGNLTVQETSAPTGYLVNDTVHTYTVGADELPVEGVFKIEVSEGYEEMPIAFDIDLVKYRDSGSDSSGTQKPCPNVQFEIISNTTGKVVATLTTDEGGTASTEGAWYGAGDVPEGIGGALPHDSAGYTVREVPETTPEGYQPTPDWVIAPEEMIDGVTLHYIVDNDFVGSRLQIVKVDAASGKPVPVAGFAFEIRDEQGNLITQETWYPQHEEISTFITDETGTVTLPQALAPGTYLVREVEAVAPYLIAADEVRVTIPQDAHTPPVTVITLPDNQATGSATLIKRCTDSSETEHLACEGVLSGAEFDVIACEDIVGWDGTVHARAQETVAHVVTDEEGRAVVDDLPLGMGSASYAFIETKTTPGHVLDTTPVSFTLTAEQDTALVETSVEMTNHPNALEILKRDAESGEPLAGASFTLWRAQDEISLEVPEGCAGIALRAEGVQEVVLEQCIGYATATAQIPEGWELVLESSDARYVLGEHLTTCEPGTYDLSLLDTEGACVDTNDQPALTLEAGCAYTFSYHEGMLGVGKGLSIAEELLEIKRHTLSYDEEQDVHMATDLSAGTWKVICDGTAVGEVPLSLNALWSGAVAEDSLTETTLLDSHASKVNLTTAEDGTAWIDHLASGTWRVRETDAPDGYLVDSSISEFTVSDEGLIEGSRSYTLTRQDDFTKVDFSKRDAETEISLEGAELALLDEKGAEIARWTSSSEDHRITHLTPGTYRLVEVLAPHEYDEASAVTFTVKATAEPQRVVMYDEPIRIAGDVDKRQQIATPTRDQTFADAVLEEGGANRAEARISEDGSFDYTIDMRSQASTWVDECTMTDWFDASMLDVAELTGITTPIAQGDFDGLVNIWYATTSHEAAATPTANATLDDGHVNPWLTHPDTQERLGDDGRVISYEGWRLWAQNIPLDEATHLSASDLPLAEGEQITGIRLEFGCVDETFATRTDDWERPLLKDEHDDLAPDAVLGGALVVHMRVTDDYRPSTPLKNDAVLDLFRNGGSLNPDEQLEDHDEDRVVQRPVEVIPTKPLPRTGSVSTAAAWVVITICLGVSAWALRRRAHHGSR